MLAVIHRVLLEVGAPPAHGAVEACALTTQGGWVGLCITSPWLLDLLSRVVAAVHTHAPPGPGEDALLPKSHLHLSLAYGVEDVGPHSVLAQALVDPGAPGGWEVAMWQRGAADLGPARWTRLPLGPSLSPSPSPSPSPSRAPCCSGVMAEVEAVPCCSDVEGAPAGNVVAVLEPGTEAGVGAGAGGGGCRPL